MRLSLLLAISTLAAVWAKPDPEMKSLGSDDGNATRRDEKCKSIDG